MMSSRLLLLCAILLGCWCQTVYVKVFSECGKRCDVQINRYVMEYDAEIVSVSMTMAVDGGDLFSTLHRDAILTYRIQDSAIEAHRQVWLPPSPPPAFPEAPVSEPPPWAARKMH